MENYRLPKHLVDKEQQDDVGNTDEIDRTKAGHAYVGKELETNFSLENGRDLFAPQHVSAGKSKQASDNKRSCDSDKEEDSSNSSVSTTTRKKRKEEKKVAKVRRKEERAKIRAEREVRRGGNRHRSSSSSKKRSKRRY